MNEKQNHLISCAGMDAERIRSASERSIEITYDLHLTLCHEPENASLGKLMRKEEKA